MKIHDIRHLDAANVYAYTQRPGISHGDVLVTGEGYAMMHSVYPVMVLPLAPHKLHELQPGMTWEDVAAGPYLPTAELKQRTLDAVSTCYALALAGGAQ